MECIASSARSNDSSVGGVSSGWGILEILETGLNSGQARSAVILPC